MENKSKGDLVDRLGAKVIGVKRVFAYIAAISIVLLLPTVYQELDEMLYEVDDLVVILLGVVILVLIVSSNRKDVTIESTKKLNKQVLLLFALAFATKVIFLVVEASDVVDVADDLPLFVILVAALFQYFI